MCFCLFTLFFSYLSVSLVLPFIWRYLLCRCRIRRSTLFSCDVHCSFIRFSNLSNRLLVCKQHNFHIQNNRGGELNAWNENPIVFGCGAAALRIAIVCVHVAPCICVKNPTLSHGMYVLAMIARRISNGSGVPNGLQQNPIQLLYHFSAFWLCFGSRNANRVH